MADLTRAQVREIDRRAIQDFKIPGVVLMENAARAATDLACRMLPAPSTGPVAEVLILCGGGNNGGDGLAVARHLHNLRYNIRIILTADPAKYQGEALINWQIVQAMKIPCFALDLPALSASKPALVIDAIFGTGLTQPPRPPFDKIVHAVEVLACDVLAIDIPSGLDCDTGRPLGACITATQTITFAARKIGFSQPGAARYLGEVTVGDIGCPRELLEPTPPASHPHS